MAGVDIKVKGQMKADHLKNTQVSRTFLLEHRESAVILIPLGTGK